MKKILIVDDISENRYVLAGFIKLLSKTKIEIVEANSGESGYNKTIEEKPDLILMDIKMETDEAGLETVRKIRHLEEFKDTQIWAITAFAMEESTYGEGDKTRCLAAGCNDYITKPYNPVEFLIKISNLFSIPLPKSLIKHF
ncbi:MAG TPA: response regulator [Spirochaetota bacterium]|nr:response regulator [Spirochaetota bacterium]